MDILVWKNKYDDRYLDASTDEMLEASARAILKELLEDGWIPKPDPVDFTEEEEEVLAMEEDQIAALPASVRESVESERAMLNRRAAAATEEAKDYNLAVNVLNNKVEARCIRERAKYDDEDWAKIVKAARNWFGAEIREDGVWRKPTAWAILQERNGAEYEDYSVESVWTPKADA